MGNSVEPIHSKGSGEWSIFLHQLRWAIKGGWGTECSLPGMDRPLAGFGASRQADPFRPWWLEVSQPALKRWVPQTGARNKRCMPRWVESCGCQALLPLAMEQTTPNLSSLKPPPLYLSTSPWVCNLCEFRWLFCWSYLWFLRQLDSFGSSTRSCLF